LTISLADGAKVEFESKSKLVKMDDAELAALTGRYGGNALRLVAKALD
jgi:hypothetical protein